MTKQLLGDTLIVVVGTLFFFGLAATVGIPSHKRKAATAVAAEEAAPVRGALIAHPLATIPRVFERGQER